MIRIFRRISACAAWCVCALVYATGASAQTTALYVDSQPGDPVGLGQIQLFTTADLTFSGSVGDAGSSVNIAATTGFAGSYWDLTFKAPVGTSLTPGLYENAGGVLFFPGVAPGLRVINSGRGCFDVIGRFVVHEIEVSAAGTLTRLAVDFEQRCTGRTAAIFGAVRFNALRSSLDPFDGAYPVYSLEIANAPHGYVIGPGLDCGAGRTDCDETYGPNALVVLEAVPSPGYVFLGWAGMDCVGGHIVAVTVSRRKFCTPVFNAAPGSALGESPDYSQGALFLDGPLGTAESTTTPLVNRQVYTSLPGGTPTASALSVLLATTTDRVGLRVSGPRNSSWDVWFVAPRGELLVPGTYEYASGLGAPAVSLFRGQSSVCDVGGRFEIYEIVFTGNVLTSFAADFEMPCGSGLTAGSIRYRSTHASLLPFDGVYPLHALRVQPTLGGYVTSAGISCGDGGRSDCQEAYAVPTNVSLRAFASPGYQFVGWSGSCVDASPFTLVAVSRSIRCIAVFTPSAGSAAPADPSLAVATLVINSPGSEDRLAPPVRVWSNVDSLVSAEVLNSGAGVRLTFSSTTSLLSAVVSFSVPIGRLTTGDYEDAHATAAGSNPVLVVSTCFVSGGRFRIYEASYDSGGNLIAFAADFEAICASGSSSTVVGAVRYHSSRSRLLPFDGMYPIFKLTVDPAINGVVTASGIDCGPGRGDCTEQYPTSRVVTVQATPSPGFRFVGWTGVCYGGPTTTVTVNWLKRCSAVFNAVQPGFGAEDPRTRQSTLFMDSRIGDPIGGGRRHVWLDVAPEDTFSDRNSVNISIAVPEGRWRFTLRAPGTAELRPGPYENATYAHSSNRNGPGISIEGPWGFCSSNGSGRFTIYQITWSTFGRLESLAVDFEHRCTPNAPALLGSLRFNSTRSELRPFPASAPASPNGDFNGDGRIDLLWQNRADGRLAAWFMHGTVAADNTSLTPDRVPDPAWHVVGTGDANRDGLSDLYLQNQTTGSLAIWYMADTARNSMVQPWPDVVVDTRWKVRTVADMDGDRSPDLLWQHTTTGQVAIWFMDGTRMRAGEPLGSGQVADLNWKIVGAGDVDRDGNADLFWHHAVTGQLAVWFMRGRVALSGQPLSPERVSDTAWQVRGVGDLDGNGSPDLIWQNTTTFQTAAWLLNGLRMIDGRLIAGPTLPNADWYVVSPK